MAEHFLELVLWYPGSIPSYRTINKMIHSLPDVPFVYNTHTHFILIFFVT